MIYYPVCIPTLCRYEHFKRCVDSLLICPEAKETDLVISVDFPTKDNHKEGRDRIIKYLGEIKGFREIKLFLQEKNLGARDNWVFVREYALNQYGAAILTEDDNCFAPSFLSYMNQALRYYWNDERVMSVTAYSPIGYESIKYPVFFSYSLCAWGLGWWKHKDCQDEGSVSYYRKILHNTRQSLKIYLRAPYILAGIINIVKTGEYLSDYGMGARNILNEKYQLRPSHSLVINYGQDGSGLHSGENSSLHYKELERGLPSDLSFNCDFSHVKVKTSSFVKRYMFWRYGGVGRFHVRPQLSTLVSYLLFRIKNK